MEGSSDGRSDTGPKKHSNDELAPVLKTSINQLAITDLTPDPRNPRIHTRAQIKAIAGSIKNFGFVLPILHKGGRIIAGHGRYEAAKLNGLTSVPVVSLDHLTEAQAKAFMIADNRLAEMSAWDKRELAVQLKELSNLRLDFEVDVTGFTIPEIDIRIQSLDSPQLSPAPDAADKFTPSTGPAVSRPGDVWHLGRHRACCGSACDAAAYETLLADAKAAAVFADFSGGAGTYDGARDVGASAQPAPAAAHEPPVNGLAQLTNTLKLASAHAVDGAIIYACITWRGMEAMLAAGRSAGCDLVDLCVWTKPGGGTDGLYRCGHELVFVFKNDVAGRVDIAPLSRRRRNRSNVWTHSLNSSARRARRGRADPLIPIKPIALVGDVILDATNPDDIILAPNLGYGTAILAAQRAGRRCYGIESDPLCIDNTIVRWENLTKGQARHACGRAFSDLKLERRGAR
jgi:ParB-like nuclease domain/DNA methylase